MASLGEHRILMEEEQMERMATLATVSLSSLNLQEAGSLASSVQAVEIETPYGPLHVTVQVCKVILGLHSCLGLLFCTCGLTI
jgi:hypothetical protein